MKLAYVARTGLGAMGEAALLQYVLKMSKENEVLVIQHGFEETAVASIPEGVRLVTVPRGSPKRRLLFVYEVLREFDPDIVHLIQSPDCFEYVMKVQPLLPSSKWILDFRSPHVGEPEALILEKFYAMQFFVDALITHSRKSLRTNVKPRFKRAHIIPPGVETQHIRRSNRFDFLPRKFVYIGSLSKTRKIDRLLEFFAGFNQQNKFDFTLDLIGGGNDEERLQRFVANNGYDKFIRFLGRLPQKELWKRLAAYDAGLSYVPEKSFSSAPSLKSVEYVAAGLPVFASDTSGHRAFCKQYGLKFHFFKNDEVGFFEAARSFCNKKVDASELDSNYLMLKKLDWQAIVMQKLGGIYENLISNR